MLSFDPQKYGTAIAGLLDPQRLCELGPGRPVQSARSALEQLTSDAMFAGQQIVDRSMAHCCLSGLWLWHDFLDESHTISQGISTTTGSFWHGIMHRREPDDANAQYWFRRVGRHPIFPQLRDATIELTSCAECSSFFDRLVQASEWNALHFVDLCSDARRNHGEPEVLCRQIARVEWQLLFDFCWNEAVGRTG